MWILPRAARERQAGRRRRRRRTAWGVDRGADSVVDIWPLDKGKSERGAGKRARAVGICD